MFGCRSFKRSCGMDASLRTIMPSCTANQRRCAVAGRPPPHRRHADKLLVNVFPNIDQRQLPSKHASARLAGLSALASSWLRSAPMTLASMILSWRVPFSTRTGLSVMLTNNARNAGLERVNNVYTMPSPRIISSQALHEKPDIAQDKLTWLQRSDADSGNRYGVLPLCLGMPVQAREHLHRGDFKILRGCHGVVCGWSAPPTETATPDGSVIWNTLPEFVFVRFQTRTRWTIPGVDAENVFPVSVQSKEWFLDAGRTTPKLKVTRYQFPLAPDFADTFHGAQGSTAEPGVIPDLCGVDPLAAYVGMTRSRTRQKILIYRPFPLAPFQAGLPLGRQLLLDVWKQEPVDWDALRKKYLDERPCQECGEMKRKDAFTKAQWKQETYRVCKECTAQKREAGTPYRCTQCGLWHAAAHFASKHQNPRWSMYRVCLTCDAVKQCFSCAKKLTKEYFTASAWKASKPDRRLCVACQQKSRGHWTCAQCCRKLPLLQFLRYSALRPGGGQDGRQMCDACRAAAVHP